MSLARKFSKNIVFIAFSDTHGDAEKLARLYTLIEETINRDREINPKAKHVLLIPGDVFSVNAIFSTISKGQFDVDVISEIAKLFPKDCRFFTPGNHDFYYDEHQLINLVETANFRVVISNTKFEENSKLKFESVARFVVDGEELTIGGLMTPETLNTAGGKKVINDAKSIDIRPAIFEKTPPDFIMSHLGSESDKQLGYRTIVVGGHTHDRQVMREEKDDKMVRLVTNTGVGECIVVIRDGGNAAEIIEAKDYMPSPKIQSIVAGYEQQCKIDLKQTVFQIAVDSILPSGLEISPEEIKQAESHLRANDTIIPRVTADGIAEELRKRGNSVDFVLYPSAAIRSNFMPGQAVKSQQLFETFYYSNRLAKMILSGSELIGLLAHGVMSGYKCWNNRGQLLAPSEGLTYGYDINQENPGDTIRWVRVNGELLNPETNYIFVTTDWIASEVAKLFPGKPIEFLPEDIKIFNLMAEYLKGRTLRESFGERVSCAQSLQEQEWLTQQEGNRRADKPKFDRYNVLINLAHHQFNYNAEQELSKHTKPERVRSLIMEYADLLFTKTYAASQKQIVSSDIQSTEVRAYSAKKCC